MSDMRPVCLLDLSMGFEYMSKGTIIVRFVRIFFLLGLKYVSDRSHKKYEVFVFINHNPMQFF